MEKRALVVDDDASVLTALRRHLTVLGFTVDTATNFVEASTLLSKNAYVVVVSDNSMPYAGGSTPKDTCGLQIFGYAKITRYNRTTPFVLHTGDTTQKTIDTVARMGGTYVRKGNTGESLEDVLKQLLLF